MKIPPARTGRSHQPFPCFGNSKELVVAAASFSDAWGLDEGLLGAPCVCIHTRVSMYYIHTFMGVFFSGKRKSSISGPLRQRQQEGVIPGWVSGRVAPVRERRQSPEGSGERRVAPSETRLSRG